MTTIVSIDYENNSEGWWDSARERRGTAPVEIAAILDPYGPDRVVIAPGRRDGIVAWCAAIPGWDNLTAPDFAPHPLVIDSAPAGGWDAVYAATEDFSGDPDGEEMAREAALGDLDDALESSTDLEERLELLWPPLPGERDEQGERTEGIE